MSLQRHILYTNTLVYTCERLCKPPPSEKLRLHVTAACLITEAGLIKRRIRKKIPEKKEKSLKQRRESRTDGGFQEAQDFLGKKYPASALVTNNFDTHKTPAMKTFKSQQGHSLCRCHPPFTHTHTKHTNHTNHQVSAEVVWHNSKLVQPKTKVYESVTLQLINTK